MRALDQGPVQIREALEPTDALFEGLDFTLAAPVRVSGQLSRSGAGRYYWAGEVATQVRAVCRRCLAPVELAISAPVRWWFTDDPLADDPSAWVIAAHATVLDLGASVREELILSVPSYVLCREDCRGLCPGCGEDLNLGSCTCRRSSDPRWGPLDAIRHGEPDDARS